MAAGGRVRQQAGDPLLIDPTRLDRIDAALAALRGWAQLAGGEPIMSRLDEAEVRRDLPVGSFSPDELAALTGLEIRVDVGVRVDEWQLTIEGEPRGALQGQHTGPVENVVEPRDAEAYRDAVARGDIEAMLAPLHGKTATVRLIFEHPADEAGFHWLSSAADLERRLIGDAWLANVRQLFRDGQPQVLVVQDGADGYVSAPAVLVCGPKAVDVAPPQRLLSDTERRFLTERGRAEEPLPSPVGLAPTESNGLAPVRQALDGVARAASWYWLAREVVTDGPPPVVRFVGTRVADVELQATPSESARDEVALFKWALSIADPQQDEAIQQAVALAVFTPVDLATAAAPALRTAKTVLRNIRRDQVTEALATQRTVRESAIAAARSAAEAARATGMKTLERVIVQAAAAAGILIANFKDAIPDYVGLLLLLLVSVLLGISATLAFYVEYPMARGTLSSFRSDLKLHEDTLSDDALRAIENMRVLEDAELTVRRSLRTSVGVIIGAGVALVSAAILICL